MDASKPKVSQSAEEDKFLIQIALNGDAKAYERLMKKYQKSVYYLSLKMIRNAQDAEDLTQESFAKAFNSIESFDQKFAFSTWLFRIATNNCIDFIRRKKLQTMSIHNQLGNEDGTNIVLQIRDKDLIPDETFLKQQRREYLMLAIERLPERYQRLIDLRYFKEYSYEEVAEKLDLPLGTVKAQLHRARELLNNELANIQETL
jgi:RNA polymerase sigma-70 factor (ECF subfamily)